MAGYFSRQDWDQRTKKQGEEYYEEWRPSQPSFTTLPRPSDLTQAFEIIDEAAINMDGVSFYVNYNIVDGTLEDVITTCFEEADCVSFDYNKGQGRAWFHK